jgi:predicted lipid-binding transport protein (Tim44 family)
MSPPRAGSGRTALGRLVDALRRRLRPERGAPPATVPGLGSGEETAVAAAGRAQEAPEHATEAEAETETPGGDLAAEPERAVTADEPLPGTQAAAVADAEPALDDADARFDAARDRLRSTIEPPPDDED